MFVLKASIVRFVLVAAALMGSIVCAADELVLTLKSGVTQSPPSDLLPPVGMASPKNSPCETIREFLHPGTGADAASKANRDLSIKRASQNQLTLSMVFDSPRAEIASPCVPVKEALDYLIATIADPINSHLPLLFDRYVESIQRAAQATGYRFDRYYFPWEQEVAREEPDLEKRRKMEAERKKQIAQPGVLLFRGIKDSGRHSPPLVVFLVLETPTSGVNQAAFASAMSYISPREQKIPILGPNFSGSFPSLLEAMTAAHKETCAKFDVITGTATARLLRKWFAGEVGELNSSFEAVVHDEGSRMTALSEHLKAEWKKQGDLALLVEDETGYGASFSDEDRKGLLRISFPREISRLRNAYQELPDLKALSEPKAAQALRQLLPFDLHGPSGHDTVPNFAKVQTPISQESVLMDIAATLRRERIRFVGIAATDVFDTIFLSRFLKSASPDIRLFSLQADRLFVRAAADFPLNGLLTVSTYPLVGVNQNWTRVKSSDYVPFADENTQGVYNGTTSLLLRLHKSWASDSDLCKPPFKPQLIEYWSPRCDIRGADCLGPPVWITVVSRTGYWPVAVIDSTEDIFCGSHKLLQSLSSYTPKGFEVKSPGRVWIFLFIAFSFLFLLYSATVWVANVNRDWQIRRWIATFWLKPLEPGCPGRAFYLLSTLLCLLGFYSALVLPFFRVQTRMEPDIYVLAIVISILTTLLLVKATIFPLVVLWNFRRSAYARLSLIPSLAFVLFVLALGLEIFSRSPHSEDFFFAYRSLDAANGVSPVFPLLLILAGLFCWAWVHLRRLVIFAERRPLLPSLGANASNSCSFARSVRDLEKDLRKAVYSPLFEVWRLSGALLVFCFVVIVLREYLQSIESSMYDWLYCGALGLLLSLVFLTWSRFLKIWWCFRAFLEQLERHPFRFSFSSFPAEHSWSPLMQRGIMQRTYALEAHALANALRRNSVAPLGGPIPDQIQMLQTRVEKLLEIVGRGNRVPSGTIIELYIQLRAMAVSFRNELLSNDWKQGSSESLNVKQKREPRAALDKKKQKAILANEFFALPYVFYIRFILLHMRNLLLFVVTGVVLAMLSINSYPFQSHHLLGWTMAIVLVVLGTGVGIVFAQTNRDAIVSRISDTKPGELDFVKFATKMIAYGALPVLTLVSSQFPAVSHALFFWVQPALESLR